jgi:hypothetical protein
MWSEHGSNGPAAACTGRDASARPWYSIGLGLLAVALLASSSAARASQLPESASLERAAVATPAGARPAAKEKALAAYGRLPLAFVPNAGQTEARVRFQAQAGGASFWFTPTEAVFAFAAERQGHVLRLGFVGANPAVEIVGRRPGLGRVNYLLGSDPAKWHTGLPTYGEVVYRGLWPGIGLAFRGRGGKLKYEFRLVPGADPSDIRLAYGGTERLSLSRAGELRIQTSVGVLRDPRPVSYQLLAGRSVPVESGYALERSTYGFALGPATTRTGRS